MKQHFFILGPPAVGKLTVGRLLSRQTNFPLYDNARAIDVAALLFHYGTENFRAFRDEQRLAFYSRVISSTVPGLISTGCLTRTSWPYFRRIDSLLSTNGWSTKYIILSASAETLISRANSPDRQFKLSLTDRISMRAWLDDNWPPFVPPDLLAHGIDTSQLAASETVSKLLALLELQDESKGTA